MRSSPVWRWMHGLIVAVTGAIVLCQGNAVVAQDMRLTKKLIATGWDHPDTARLRENLALMEQRPFDGVVLDAIGRTGDGTNVGLRGAFQSQPWQRDWFQNCVDDLKACRSQRLSNNFVTVGANPGNVDWFDDAGWEQVVDHWRIAAWIAKEGGVKGILFDPEPYTEPFSQFRYGAQSERDKHTFKEYHAKARARGRQVMGAIAGEYPEITLFCYFMNIVNRTATGHADPRRMLATMGYGLYSPFIDGWLDVAPPTVKLVDGCERAYRYNSVTEYLESALQIKGVCQELVSPENRGKYRAQVQVSFGMYLDAYWNPETSPWHIDGLGGPRVDRLRANTSTALRVADEYVWVYGEQFRWWPTPNGRVKPETWPEALPGSEAALRFARDPVDYARTTLARLEKEEKLVNLTRNGDFGSDKAPTNQGPAEDWKEGGAPAGWHTWQTQDSHGTFAWDRERGRVAKGAARAAGVSSGCFIQSCEVKPGERYAVRAFARRQGKSATSIRIRWQADDGKWIAEAREVMVLFEAPEGDDPWEAALGVAEVPEGVGKLVVLLGVADQPSAEDAALFDDVDLYRLE